MYNDSFLKERSVTATQLLTPHSTLLTPHSSLFSALKEMYKVHLKGKCKRQKRTPHEGCLFCLFGDGVMIFFLRTSTDADEVSIEPL